MPSRYAWVVYTLTIPFIIILVLLLKARDSTNIGQTQHWPNLAGSYNRIQFAWNRQLSEFKLKEVEGRYVAVRRDLGLDEQLILLPSSLDSFASGVNKPSIRSRSPSHRPRIKRALDFILVDEAEPSPGSSHADLPVSDDADNIPLKLTEDALWDYSNSKQTILDNFARAALLDEEDAAAETLAKSIRAKMRAKFKGKKKKKVADEIPSSRHRRIRSEAITTPTT